MSQASEQQILKLSIDTKAQRHSPLWFAQRRGRITSSNIYKIMNLGISCNSTVNQILQNSNELSAIPSIKWGIDNEEIAKTQYCSFMSQNHENFKFEEVGLVLFKPFTFLAASPDGLSKCDCHGASVVEIKCPYKYRNSEITDPVTLSDKTHFLDNNLCLKSNHKYYSQIQTQMLVCGVNQCDLVVWTTKDLVISQVVKNETFCNSLVARVKKFTTHFLIPQLLNDRIQEESLQDFSDLGTDRVFCSCNRPKFGKMICCENINCKIGFFHYECVELKRRPKGTWFCSECSSKQSCN